MGEVVPHATLQAALGPRAAGCYMAIHYLRGMLFSEAWHPPGCGGWGRKHHTFRVKAHKGVGYQPSPPACGCCPRPDTPALATGVG